MVTRAVLFSAGNLIREEDLVFTPYPSGAPTSSQATGEGMGGRPSAVQLKELLASAGGNVSALARHLQVCSKTIYRWARSHHIDLVGIRGAAAI